MSGNVLVGGGTGFVGKYLCTALKQKGYNVTIASRMPGPQRISWQDLQADGLPKNTKAVINLAGQNVMDYKQRWTAGFKQNVFNSRVNTTKALAKAITESKDKPSVFLTMSGVGVYKPNGQIEYSEDTKVESFDFFSKLCLEWEKASQLPDSSCRVVNIRSGVVLGREGGMIGQLYMPFFLGLGGPVGSGQQYLPWIHINDLTRLILFAVETPSVDGVLNGVAPKAATNKQFSDAFAKALHRPAFLPVPTFVLNLLLSKERAIMITKGQKVSPKRTESLGFKFDYPNIEAACRNLVENKS